MLMSCCKSLAQGHASNCLPVEPALTGGQLSTVAITGIRVVWQLYDMEHEQAQVDTAECLHEHLPVPCAPCMQSECMVNTVRYIWSP